MITFEISSASRSMKNMRKRSSIAHGPQLANFTHRSFRRIRFSEVKLTWRGFERPLSAGNRSCLNEGPPYVPADKTNVNFNIAQEPAIESRSLKRRFSRGFPRAQSRNVARNTCAPKYSLDGKQLRPGCATTNADFPNFQRDFFCGTPKGPNFLARQKIARALQLFSAYCARISTRHFTARITRTRRNSREEQRKYISDFT